MGMCKFFLYFYLIRSLVLIQVNQEIIKKHFFIVTMTVNIFGDYKVILIAKKDGARALLETVLERAEPVQQLVDLSFIEDNDLVMWWNVKEIKFIQAVC